MPFAPMTLRSFAGQAYSDFPVEDCAVCGVKAAPTEPSSLLVAYFEIVISL